MMWDGNSKLQWFRDYLGFMPPSYKGEEGRVLGVGMGMVPKINKQYLVFVASVSVVFLQSFKIYLGSN